MKKIPCLYLLGGFILLASCVAEEGPEGPTEKTSSVNEWIASEMRKNYLWYQQIPSDGALDYTLDEAAFFRSLLCNSDGKDHVDAMGKTYHSYYSYIEKATGATKGYMGGSYSYGFEYQYWYIKSINTYALQVLYVLPDSPAEAAGLKRGDWVMGINGQPIPDTSAALLAAMDCSTPQTHSFQISGSLSGATHSLSLQPAVVTDNPVFLDTVYSYQNHRIAYLVYNHFTSGPGGSLDYTFDNSLRAACTRMKAKGPTDCILDLRYNGGGLVSSAQLLASLLVPTQVVGEVFCNLSYNGQSYPNTSARFLSEGNSLNLQRLYVITSSRTASASEAVINGLKPFVQLVLIGEQTEGKNVASITIEDDSHTWLMHPIVAKLSNAQDFSDYAKGFAPDFPCTEDAQDTFYALGDTREFILSQVLDYIVKGETPQTGIKAAVLRSALYSSTERRGQLLIDK